MLTTGSTGRLALLGFSLELAQFNVQVREGDGVQGVSFRHLREARLTGQDQDLHELEQVGAFTLVLGSTGFAVALGLARSSWVRRCYFSGRPT